MEEILVITLCLLFNALLAAFEMAFVSVSRGALRRAEKNGSREATRVLRRREQPERTLSIIQIGTTLVGALAAAVGGVGAAQNIQPYLVRQFEMRPLTAEILSLFLVVLPLTYLSVVLGELTPKLLAIRSPLSIVLRGSSWVSIADRFLRPAASFLEWSTQKTLRLFFPSAPTETQIPENTIDLDLLTPGHRHAVLNLARIEDRPTRDILVPWKDVTYIRVSDTMEDLVPIVFASGHTRLPVYQNEGIAGILHTKEFLAFRENGGKDWHILIQPVLRVRVQETALSVLRLMQNQRKHMAIVYSPRGVLLGLITMEDIFEEFLGDIFDEDEDSRIRRVFAEKVRLKGRLKRG